MILEPLALLERKPGSPGRLCRDGGRPLRYGGLCHHWAKLLGNGLENVTFTGRQLETASLKSASLKSHSGLCRREFGRLGGDLGAIGVIGAVASCRCSFRGDLINP